MTVTHHAWHATFNDVACHYSPRKEVGFSALSANKFRTVNIINTCIYFIIIIFCQY
jgi:hypothetical protein